MKKIRFITEKEYKRLNTPYFFSDDYCPICNRKIYFKKPQIYNGNGKKTIPEYQLEWEGECPYCGKYLEVSYSWVPVFSIEPAPKEKQCKEVGDPVEEMILRMRGWRA